MSHKKIRILLVDDHNVIRRGIRLLLESQEDFEVVGEAEHGREGVRCALVLKPDVVVMDIAMPFLNGVDATVQILKNSPEIKVVILSMHDDDEFVTRCIKSGAVGYIVKHSCCTELSSAIRESVKGNSFFSASISARIRDRCRRAFLNGRNPEAELSPREREVLQLIAESYSNKQIAAEFGIGIKTVEKHRQSIMHKLDLHDAARLTRYAISKGIINVSVFNPMS